jgi:tetratricopeptide (TPR) repeat protein
MALTLSDDEFNLVVDALGLRQRVQDMYDDSRAHAQRSEWEAQLRVATSMVPALALLDMPEWLARIYGRMAWSCIRIGNEARARGLLAYSEAHDQWQAAANYYWAAEYSERSRSPGFARECMEGFRRLCGELKIEAARATGDLTLAVAFYERLVQHEQTQSTFQQANNQSDIGRYLELRARLEQNPKDFEEAARHYRLAHLEPYAVGCVVFARLSEALGVRSEYARRRLYEEALAAMREAPMFADEDIGELLKQYLHVRLVACELVMAVDQLTRDPLRAASVEELYRSLHEAFSDGDGARTLGTLGAAIPNLCVTQAWSSLTGLVSRLAEGPVPLDETSAATVTELLDETQRYLPSLSFLVVPKEEK